MDSQQMLNSLPMNVKKIPAALLLALFIISTAIAQTPQPILRLNTNMHFGEIWRISSDSRGKYILTCSMDKTAKLWDASDGALIRTFRPPIDQGDQGMLFACALAPDGNIAAVGGYTGQKGNHSIYIFNTTTGELVQKITGLENMIMDLEFSLDGKYMAVALSRKGGVRVFKRADSLMKFDTLSRLGGYNDMCLNISFDNSGRLAAITFDGYLKLYDNTYAIIKEVQTSGGKQAISVAFSPDGRKIAVGYTDSPTIDVYDGITLDLLYKPDISGTKNLNNGVSVLAFSADERYLFGGGYYSIVNNNDSIDWIQIRRWENEGKGIFSDFNACQNVMRDIKSQPDNSIIFCGAMPVFGRMKSDGTVVFYKPGETSHFNNGQPEYLKINRNGTEISFKPVETHVLFFHVKKKQLSGNSSGFENLRSSTDSLGNINIGPWQRALFPELNSKKLKFLEQYEQTQCVDISADTTSIVFGTVGALYCLNALGEQKWTALTQAEVWAVTIPEDNRTVVAAMADGTIRWYRMTDGALLLTLFVRPDNKRWVLYTANGYYISSEGGDELFGWHINNGADTAANFYPARNYADQFFRPDIVSEVLDSCQTDLEILKRKDEQQTDISKKPPLVKIISPSNNSIISNCQLTINVDVTDQGGGIDEVRLYLNGKLMETTQRGITFLADSNSKNIRTFKITLTGGENRLKATAFNNSRTEAIADEVVVTCQGAKAMSDLYLFLVGINEYKNPRYKLNYAVPDAISINAAMGTGTKNIFGKVETIFIQDANATRKSILEKFNEMKAKAKPEDVFVFYYAGHGVMSEDQSPQFYIAPSDVTQLVNTNAEMQKVAISADELRTFSKELKAQKQLFIFDACQSGGLVEALASSRGVLEERAIAQLARSTGTYWLAASGSQQFATEFVTLGHGLFTYTILQGLKGGADGNIDKKITVEELSTFVKNNLPEFSEKYKGGAQYPYSFGYGMDFPIFILK
jgi:WD40 repeat protein